MTSFAPKRLQAGILVVFFWFAALPAAWALGECGLSCCIGGTSTSGVTLGKTLGLSAQYEYTDMETIRHGSGELTPDEVLNRFWVMGSSYAVPTKMTMEKLSLIAAKPVNERWQVLGVVPFVRNNMDMRMRMPMGMVMNMEMEEISGLGDVTVLGLYTAYTDAPVRPNSRLTLGFGVKTPTGKNDETTPSGSMVHAMMQPGTGSWDAILTLNYLRAWYPLITQINAFYHYSTESNEGYEFGDQAGLDLIARYQAGTYINLGLSLSAIHAGKDTDHDGQYSRPANSMPDNTDNTGLTSVFIAPGVQYKIPDTGGNVELKYQLPLHQHVNGYQQVVDSRWLLTASWAW